MACFPPWYIDSWKSLLKQFFITPATKIPFMAAGNKIDCNG